jgi:hypothetical protein
MPRDPTPAPFSRYLPAFHEFWHLASADTADLVRRTEQLRHDLDDWHRNRRRRSRLTLVESTPIEFVRSLP